VQIPAYAKDILRGNERSVTLLLAAFIVGIGAGSFLCEWLTRQQRVRMRLLILVGGLGLSLFALDIYFASQTIGLGVTPLATGALLSATALLHQPAIFRVLADLTGLGICGGLFTVPLYTLLQQASEPTYRARMIAANNIVNALFMVLGALGAAAMLAAGVSIPALFALIALANVAAVSGLYWVLPKI
jgi:MFS family permease